MERANPRIGGDVRRKEGNGDGQVAAKEVLIAEDGIHPLIITGKFGKKRRYHAKELYQSKQRDDDSGDDDRRRDAGAALRVGEQVGIDGDQGEQRRITDAFFNDTRLHLRHDDA